MEEEEKLKKNGRRIYFNGRNERFEIKYTLVNDLCGSFAVQQADELRCRFVESKMLRIFCAALCEGPSFNWETSILRTITIFTYAEGVSQTKNGRLLVIYRWCTNMCTLPCAVVLNCPQMRVLQWSLIPKI